MLRIWCRKVLLLSEDETVERMGTASRARLEERFAPKAHYDALMKIFDQVRKNHGK